MPKEGRVRPGGEKSRATRARPHPFAGRKGPRKSVLGEVVAASVGAIAVNPAANAVIADTGALAAGDYRVSAYLGASGAVGAGKSVVLAHRNAANNADVKILGICPCGDSGAVAIARITLAANERIVIRAGSAATVAAEEYGGSVQAFAIPS